MALQITRNALLIAAGGLAVAGSAVATTLVSDAPAFAEAPSVSDVAAAYPARAKTQGLSGKARLTCSIGSDRRPRDCAALTESPSGYGFGAAAIKLAEAHLKVATDSLYKQNVFIPFTFDAKVLQGSATITQPAWAELPSAEDFQATFPKTENGVNHVRVVLGCTVAADGSLSGCGVNSEDPTGQGYGQGALQLASKFKLAAWGADGEPAIGAHINLPIRYELTPVKAK